MNFFSFKLSITPRKLKSWMDDGIPLQIIDLRPVADHEVVSIEGSISITMDEIPLQLNKISVDKTVVLYCRLGIKGKDIAADLRRKLNKKDIYFLRDGLLGWAIDIDKSMPQDLL